MYRRAMKLDVLKCKRVNICYGGMYGDGWAEVRTMRSDLPVIGCQYPRDTIDQNARP